MTTTTTQETGELVFIPADLAQPVERTECGTLEGLAPLHRAIDPGYVEALTVTWKGKAATLFVHEEGRLRKLPVNARATAVYRSGLMFRQIQTGKQYTSLDDDPARFVDDNGTKIVGDCFLFTGKMRSGE